MKELIGKLRAEWSARTERERQILMGGGIALLALVAWAGIWKPLTELHERRAADLDLARSIAIQLEQLAAHGSSRPASKRQGNSNRSLLSIVDRSSKRSQIDKKPTRIQPEGDAEVRVWFDDVPFDQVLRWVFDLSTREGVEVSEAVFDRQSGSGLVNVRLTLVRQ